MNPDARLADARTRLADGRDRLARGVARRFAVDLRALAAFRIAVGALVLADLALRSRDLVAFYTDAGVLPREGLFTLYGRVYSLHAISGEAWAQALLFLLAGGFGLAMLAGYRTRVATVGSWLLLCSLHLRNPMVLNGGDTLLRMLLFWAMFLPLGERWALDARRTDRERTFVASAGTVALLGQVVLVYATNAVHKLRGDAWTSGEALVYVFTADQYTILLGNALGEYRAVLELGTYLWLALVLVSPLLVALAGVPRAALASAFVGMHLGMAVTLRIDLFPLIVVAGLLPFYPPVVWDAAESLAARIGVGVPRIPVPHLARISAPSLSRTSAPSLPAVPIRSERFDRLRAGCFAVLPCVFFALVLASNAAAVDYAEVPDPADRALDVALADQNWNMFAPNPARTTRWFAAPGALENGTEIDVFDGSRVDLDRPPSVEATYPTSRWRKYLSNVRATSDAEHRSYLGNYLCDRWNDRHETGVVNVSVYEAYERVDPYDGTASTDEVELQEYDCSGDLVQNDG